jgi:predicted RNase H-like nuclease (RuvC/YqgF family)
MNRAQIDRLVAGVSPNVDERQRRRINGYAATARRCDERIAELRDELERALRTVDDSAAAGQAVEAADEAIRLTRELDALERIQPRIDSWLRATAGALSGHPGLEPFGEGPA